MNQDRPSPNRPAQRLSRPERSPNQPQNPVSPETSRSPSWPALGRYSHAQRIGEGGMGVVFEAVDPRLDRTVAIKVLRPEHRNIPRLQNKFRNEAESLGKLDHPNIVPIFDMDQTGDGLPFFTMKKIKGETLAEHLMNRSIHQQTSQERYDGTPLLYLFLKICEAISFAHFHGILHRDLKPDNIMIGPFGEVLVTDWGLARKPGDPLDTENKSPSETTNPKWQTDPDNPQVTQEGEIIGTPMYMSPEQARGENHLVDARSDIYSLGAILYEIMTLTPLHEGKSVAQILEASLEENQTPPSQRAPEAMIPEELENVIRRAMSHKPVNRYPDVSAMLDDLRAFLDGRPLSSMQYGLLTRFRQWIQAHQPLTQTVGIAFLLVFSILFFFSWKDWNHRRNRFDQARQQAQPLLTKGQSPPLHKLLHASTQLDQALHLDPQHTQGRQLRQQIGLRLGHQALEAGHYLLARAAFEQLAKTGLEPETVQSLLEKTESAEQSEQHRAHQRIRDILQELRLGLSRPGRDPGAPLLEDYIHEGLSLLDTQSAPILIEDLFQLTDKSRVDPENTVWTQEERDRASFDTRLLSRIASHSAIETLSQWLEVLRDPQMILETARALCNSRNPSAHPALQQVRTRLGPDSQLWKRIEPFLIRLHTAKEARSFHPEHSR